MKAIVPITTLLAVICGMTASATAQVVSDNTVSTQVIQSGAVFNINNGMRSGNNLFHSFSEFSVPKSGSAVFNNALDVQNIFSRVTGSKLSDIDGILKTQGTTNLFLMNPNGIVFGQNAQLQLGGSFLGTTASSIKFADGIEFNTVNATPALLSVNLPIGLQMGTQPGRIQVNGTGHSLASLSSTLTPYVSTGLTAGLKVQPGKTLALVGGPIDLIGGTLTAERGRIELGSLGAGETAGLENVGTPLWNLNTAATGKFSDITLSNRSIVDVSGAGAGSIQVQGQGVTLTDGSLIFSQNLGIAPGGDIRVKADSLNLIGGIANRNIRSAIFNETRFGNSGNVLVTARQLNLIDGGSLFSRSFGLGSSGNVTINASESVKMDGFLAANPELNSGIGTVSFSPLVTGRAGNITISTPTLSLQNGAIITATTFGNAAAGNVNINADRIEVVGLNPTFLPSTIASTTLGKGNAGSIMVNTRSLLVKDDGNLSTASYNHGDAGSIIINASESVEIRKEGDISSSTSPNNPALIAVLNLPQQPRGNAGSIVINVPILKVQDQGRIIVSNRGLGNSGKVSITADQILLDRNSQIAAATSSGEGGNVVLKSQALILRNGSGITATAGGLGNGGNITIDSPIMVGLENSDIIANASIGRGGTIAITTQGILGLKYRTVLTPGNDITASSEFGISGNVQVNTIGINPANSLNVLPTDITDSSRQIADRCGAAKTSSFIATGRGGIPQDPRKRQGHDRPWNDLRPIATTTNTALQPLAESALGTIARSQPLVEASALTRDSSGTIALVAAKPIRVQPSATCGA